MTATTHKQALTDAQALGLARIDAQLLLLHTLGRDPNDRAWLLAHDTDTLTEAQAAQLAGLCQRRAAGEPVAYLTGGKAFYGLRLQVDARVLDPRPDTETLVDWALAVLQGQTAPRVVDLGTGSGAVALALQHQRPQAEVHAVDASAGALAVAQANAQRLGLPVRFWGGSWFQPLPADVRFDAIVSNPPYVAEADPHLAALTHEPLSALTSGPDGLDDIRTIVAQAGTHLAPGGWLLLEHGHDQGAAVRALLQDAGFSAVNSRTDLAGLERCSGGRWPGRG
ncbi:peptide chain release factor N(5)-glutamine methyltransferase [Hydrogenophaga sp. OTU3427]|uniref:peptide chain release factor N(5)-glutamine methyltransferase n=1 Tax=Hydrogenophaga sp. OTU3427 TaxID=3043856 RepID=UPI00313A92CE